MATPVPYEGAPNVTPDFRPTPSIAVSTPPAAFGADIAQAVEHLGQVNENAGKELFDRAYAMQDLQEHANANAALADAQNKMADRYVQYSQLEGKNAVDAYPDFQAGLNADRVSGGRSLSPIGRSYYDAESRNSLFRMNFSGATHAKEEQKKYIIGSADAAVESASKNIQADPSNPELAEASLKQIRETVAHKYGDIGGMSPEEVKQKQADAVNTAVNGRIRSLAKDSPIAAQKLLDQAIKDGDLYGNDVTNLSWYVRNQRDVIGSRARASQVMQEGHLGGGPVLRALFRNESGGQDINNITQGTTSGQAQGYFQITTGTWREFADKAGIDLREYPIPHGTPYSVQAQVANVIPLRRWDPTTIAVMRAAGGKLDVNKTLGENLAMNGEGLGSGITPKPTLADLTRRAGVVAENDFPGDAGYRDAVVDRVITQFNKEEAIQRDTDFNNEQAISGVLLTGVGANHIIPTSIEELRQDPAASAAWDQLESQHPTELQKFMRQMSTNARGDVAMTPERLDNWQKLSGEAVQDPDKFMKDTADLSTLDLPREQKLEIIRIQKSIYKKEDANPPVTHAIGLLNQTGVLSAAGLTKDQDPDNLHLFTGVLSEAMSAYQQANGKPMSDEDIKTTAQQLLAAPPKAHIWSYANKPEYQTLSEVPKEASDAISAQLKARGMMPTDQLILQMYLTAQFQELYGKKTTPPSGSDYTPQRFPQTSPNIKTFQ